MQDTLSHKLLEFLGFLQTLPRILTVSDLGPPSETDCRPIEDAAAFSWDASSVFSESVRIMKNMPEEFGFGFAFAFVVQGPYSCMSLLQRWPSFFSSCVPFQG